MLYMCWHDVMLYMCYQTDLQMFLQRESWYSVLARGRTSVGGNHRTEMFAVRAGPWRWHWVLQLNHVEAKLRREKIFQSYSVLELRHDEEYRDRFGNNTNYY